MSAVPLEVLADSRVDERAECPYLWPPLILSVVLLWIVPMGSSLGLDESGNWWVVKDGFRTMLTRVSMWPGGQSVLFNSLVMAARAVGGDSDIAMRMPALLMALGSVYLLYRLGKRLVGPLAAMFSCLAFVTMREVVYVASTVRPYSLGLLLVIGAMLCLVDWLDTGRVRSAVGYVVFASLTLYATLVYATMFLVHALYASYRIRARESAIRPVTLVAAWAVSGVLMLPLAYQVLALYAKRAQEAYLGVTALNDFLTSIAPPPLLGAAALAALLAIALRRPVMFFANLLPAEGWLIATWTIIPPGVLYLLSLFTDVQLFTGRYYLANAPAVALAAGLMLRGAGPAQFRRLIAGVLAMCAIFAYGFNEDFMRGLNDYRGAVAAVRKRVRDSQVPVLMIPGFVEGAKVATVLSSSVREAMFAPLLRYGIPGQLIPVPNLLDEEAEQYMDRVIATTLKDQKEFLVVGLFRVEFYRRWLEGRCRSLGFTDRLYGEYSGVEVYLFERSHV